MRVNTRMGESMPGSDIGVPRTDWRRAGAGGGSAAPRSSGAGTGGRAAPQNGQPARSSGLRHTGQHVYQSLSMELHREH